MSNLFKTLALTGFATLSAGAALATHQNQASAKTYAKVVYNHTLPQAGSARNVVTTGTNALYSKAGTLKGARILASKSILGYMGSSKNSNDYFRAYRVAKTNRGVVYFKIVSFDQKYRGWIYGGRSASTFASGINVTNTVSETSLSADESTKIYEFTNPGTTNVTWSAPFRSQYKAHKLASSMSQYAGDDLRITKAVRLSREGTKYYEVTSAQHPSINGWIAAGGIGMKDTSKTPDREFSASQVQVKSDATTNESNADKITAAKNAYAALLGNSSYTYNTSNFADFNKIRTDLRDGQTITANGVNYSVQVLISQNADVSVVLTQQVNNAVTVNVNPNNPVSLDWVGVMAYQKQYAEALSSITKTMKIADIVTKLGASSDKPIASWGLNFKAIVDVKGYDGDVTGVNVTIKKIEKTPSQDRTFKTDQIDVRSDNVNKETDSNKVKAAQAAYAQLLGETTYSYNTNSTATFSQIKKDLLDGQVVTTDSGKYTVSVKVTEDSNVTVTMRPNVTAAIRVVVEFKPGKDSDDKGKQNYLNMYDKELKSVNSGMSVAEIKLLLHRPNETISGSWPNMMDWDVLVQGNDGAVTAVIVQLYVHH